MPILPPSARSMTPYAVKEGVSLTGRAHCSARQARRQRRPPTGAVPTCNRGTHAEVVPKDTGAAQTEETGDRRPEQRPTPPNKAVELLGKSWRFFPAAHRGRWTASHDTLHRMTEYCSTRGILAAWNLSGMIEKRDITYRSTASPLPKPRPYFMTHSRSLLTIPTIRTMRIGSSLLAHIGTSAQARLLMAAHTDRGDRIRIISARTLKPKERRLYESGS
jgi:uncharacterized protein